MHITTTVSECFAALGSICCIIGACTH